MPKPKPPKIHYCGVNCAAKWRIVVLTWDEVTCKACLNQRKDFPQHVFFPPKGATECPQ